MRLLLKVLMDILALLWVAAVLDSLLTGVTVRQILTRDSSF